MAKAKKIESNLLDELLGPVDPLAYAQVRNTMMLATKIDEARINKKWSKVKFAREMGRSPSEVTKWLSGTHNFGVHLLTELEMKLGIRLLNSQEEMRRADTAVVVVAASRKVGTPPAGKRVLGGGISFPVTGVLTKAMA